MHTAVPLHYEITIEPDMEAFTFSGTVEVTLQADAPVESITLNALELSVDECFVGGDGKWESCTMDIDEHKERLTIRLPGSVSGRFQCRIRYAGVIGDGMAGFYRSGYTVNGGIRYLAVTQFQESMARRWPSEEAGPLGAPCFPLDRGS